MKRKIILAVVAILLVGGGWAAAEILTADQLGDIKLMAARFLVTEEQVDALIAEAQDTQQKAFDAYVQQKHIVRWLKESGMDTSEIDYIVSNQP